MNKTFYVAPELWRRFSAACKAQGIPISQQLTALMRAWLAELPAIYPHADF